MNYLEAVKNWSEVAKRIIERNQDELEEAHKEMELEMIRKIEEVE